MPTKLARTVASSVCGLVCHWNSVTTTAMTAATTIPVPINRPTVRRAPGPDAICFSAIMLTSEQSDDEYERDENAKTRIDQRWWPYIRMKPRPNKEPPSEQSRANPDQSAEHPGRKKRADNIDLWSHRSPSYGPGGGIPVVNASAAD